MSFMTTMTILTFFSDTDIKEDEVVEQIMEAVDGAFQSVKSIADLAMKPPSEMAGGLYTQIMGVSNTVVKPIGVSLLTLFLMIELAHLFKRQEARGVDSIYFITMIILKCGVAKMLMQNIDTIISMAFSVTTLIGTKVTQTMGMEITKAEPEVRSALSEVLNDSSYFQRIGVWLMVVIFEVVDWVLNMLCRIVVYLRFIEIFIFSAIGPIPVATWPSKEYSSIFRNWLKRIIGLALHAVLILLCLLFYVQAVNGGIAFDFVGAGTGMTEAQWITASSADHGWIYTVFGFLISILGPKFMLVMSLFQTSGWAKSLAGAA